MSSVTRARSSFNSETEASILDRLKSLIGTFCTISHLPPFVRIGNEQITVGQRRSNLRSDGPFALVNPGCLLLFMRTGIGYTKDEQREQHRTD